MRARMLARARRDDLRERQMTKKTPSDADAQAIASANAALVRFIDIAKSNAPDAILAGAREEAHDALATAAAEISAPETAASIEAFLPSLKDIDGTPIDRDITLRHQSLSRTLRPAKAPAVMLEDYPA
jgi:hypothetical protein